MESFAAGIGTLSEPRSSLLSPPMVRAERNGETFVFRYEPRTRYHAARLEIDSPIRHEGRLTIASARWMRLFKFGPPLIGQQTLGIDRTIDWRADNADLAQALMKQEDVTAALQDVARVMVVCGRIRVTCEMESARQPNLAFLDMFAPNYGEAGTQELLQKLWRVVQLLRDRIEHGAGVPA